MQVCAVASTSASPTFTQALRFWIKLGWISFGGPTGQIAILHEELVARRGWISEAEFVQGLNFCLMLPGPEAQQLATYLGWRLHGVRGALAAGILFVLPAVFVLWGLSLLYVLAGTVPVVTAAFYGLSAVVMSIIVRALWGLARRTLKSPADLAVTVVAALLMGPGHVSYLLVVLGAGLAGAVIYRGTKTPVPADDLPAAIRIGPILRTAFFCLAAWFAPLLLAWLVLGGRSIVVREGLFFSKAALVTFGGAYAVLPYVAQHAVAQYHWLTAGDMLHGFALAETTPGPLVIVLQFVAFMGAWNEPGSLSPLLAATLGSLMVSWVTFAPSFLFVLTGGPFLRHVVRWRFLQGALRGISAAVVGVMTDFALWFGGSLLFPGQRYTQPDWFVLAIGVAGFIALVRFRVSIPVLLVGGAVAGVAWRVAFAAR